MSSPAVGGKVRGSTSAGAGDTRDQDAPTPTLLGAACCVHTSDAGVRRGTLLEVRRLWTPTAFSSPEKGVEGKATDSGGNNELENDSTAASLRSALYGFVRVKDLDHRMSGWFPVDNIELKEPRAGALPNVEAPRINGPILSSVYSEVTPGMMRTQHGEKPLDFFEERLLRDCRTPTTIRYFVYLCKYVFSPWYYAPYGILHREYDPTAPVTDEECRMFGVGDVGGTNPFIRDAYLCPFSLRVYSTFEQMFHETREYRGGRLRPPGQEVYRDEVRGFSMFEVNGSREVTYCRHLFLLGKSFLENKLAGHDVHNYYFYVVCLHQWHFQHYTDDPSAMYFVGYFSWEKQVVDNNLACIVCLPCFVGRAAKQRTINGNSGADGAQASPGTTVDDGPRLTHFGYFMIAASYELAYRRKHVGSPEKPLTDLGAAAYDRYWRDVLIKWMYTLLEEQSPPVASVDEKGDTEHTVVVTYVDDSPPLKRPRSGDAAGSSSPADNRSAHASKDETLAVTDVRQIAKQVQLEEADVLRTLLRMGVLHLNAEYRSLRLVIPVPFVHREYAKIQRWESDTTRAVFDPKLLTGRGATAFVPSSVSTRRNHREQQ
ncbi:putative histone acetyltransferase [Trypanosoma vivax]|nr:putative histone acetyltransferase [Trypanosoma vivax]